MDESDSFCINCGVKLENNTKFCPKCGLRVDPNDDSNENIRYVKDGQNQKGRSKEGKSHSGAWYLLPIFLGFIGGLIMWLVLRDDNKSMAQKGMIVGIIISVIVGIYYIATWFAIMTMDYPFT